MAAPRRWPRGSPDAHDKRVKNVSSGPREEVPLKTPGGPSLLKTKRHRGPSREPLGSLGHPRSGPSWLPVLRLTSAPCFSGFTGRWSFPLFQEVISRVPNLDPGSSALSASLPQPSPIPARRRFRGIHISAKRAHEAFNFANQCLAKFITECSMCQTMLNTRRSMEADGGHKKAARRRLWMGLDGDL